jgi:hypothetical protein
MTTDDAHGADGRVLDPGRVADHLAIQDLATAYAYAVDDRDWVRWEALFEPDGLVDYTSAGGIAGTPAEVAAWMPGAMSVFVFCLHTTSTHEIRFTGPDTAVGRVHVFNRNGVEWDGANELFDVGAWYEDSYARSGAGWRIARRIEHTTYVDGGGFARMILDMARASATDDRPAPFG